jgi:hypothetical protein
VVFGGADLGERLKLDNLDGRNGFRFEGNGGGDALGLAVGSGDINNDGFSDVMVGAPNAGPDYRRRAGEVAVVFGHAGKFRSNIRPHVLNGEDGFTIIGPGKSDRVGEAVAGAGDVNGDGYGDILIGASASRHGNAFLVLGKAGGFPPTLDLGTLDGSNGVRFDNPNSFSTGWTVASAGDINHDGFDDMMIGEPYPNDDVGLPGGAVFVVFGRGDGFPAAIDLTELDGTDGFVMARASAGILGEAIGGGGDVNGDGIDDVILGGQLTTVGPIEAAGAAVVVFGRSTPFPPFLTLKKLTPQEGFQIDGNSYEGRAGTSVAIAPDINGDGFDDPVVGAPRVPIPYYRGAAYVVYGSDVPFPDHLRVSRLDGSNGFTAVGAAENTMLGQSVSGAGDVNGDGIGDLLLGAPQTKLGDRVWAGEVFVVYGR